MRRDEGNRAEKVQAVVFVVASMAVLIGVVGLGADAGQLYAAKQREPAIADAVAQAAVMDLFRGTNTVANGNNFGTGRVKCPTSGGIKPCAYAQQNGMTSSDTVTLDFACQGCTNAFNTDNANCIVTNVTLSTTASDST